MLWIIFQEYLELVKNREKLIQEFGSIENIIANADKLKGKQRENVENYAEQGLISKKLATILLDVPVELEEEKLLLEEPNKDILEPLFIELEFRTLGKRVFGELNNSTESSKNTSGQMDLFSLPQDAEILEEETYAGPVNNLENTSHEYILVNTKVEQEALAKQLSSLTSFCFDTESTGLDANLADIVGLSFSFEKGKAFYVPTPEDRQQAQEVINIFKPVLENDQIEKVGQNIKYDILLLARYEVGVKGPIFDTMLAHYLIDPDTRHGMDVLAENYLNYKPLSITELIGSKGKNKETCAMLSLI